MTDDDLGPPPIVRVVYTTPAPIRESPSPDSTSFNPLIKAMKSVRFQDVSKANGTSKPKEKGPVLQRLPKNNISREVVMAPPQKKGIIKPSRQAAPTSKALKNFPALTPAKKPCTVDLLDDSADSSPPAPRSKPVKKSSDDLIDVEEFLAAPARSKPVSKLSSEAVVIPEFGFLAASEGSGTEIFPKNTEAFHQNKVEACNTTVSQEEYKMSNRPTAATNGHAVKNSSARMPVKQHKLEEPKTPEFTDSDEEWVNPATQNLDGNDKPRFHTKPGEKKKFVFSCTPNGNVFSGIRTRKSEQMSASDIQKYTSQEDTSAHKPEASNEESWPAFPTNSERSGSSVDTETTPESVEGLHENDIWVPDDDDLTDSEVTTPEQPQPGPAIYEPRNSEKPDNGSMREYDRMLSEMSIATNGSETLTESPPSPPHKKIALPSKKVETINHFKARNKKPVAPALARMSLNTKAARKAAVSDSSDDEYEEWPEFDNIIEKDLQESEDSSIEIQNDNRVIVIHNDDKEEAFNPLKMAKGKFKSLRTKGNTNGHILSGEKPHTKRHLSPSDLSTGVKPSFKNQKQTSPPSQPFRSSSRMNRVHTPPPISFRDNRRDSNGKLLPDISPTIVSRRSPSPPSLRPFHMGPRPTKFDNGRDRRRGPRAGDYLPDSEECPYESIREVRLTDLPDRAHLWHILERVRGGALELARYSMKSRSIDLVFLRHENARAFWEYVNENGFFIPIPNGTHGFMTDRKEVTLSPFTRIPGLGYLTSDELERLRETHGSRVLILINVPRHFNGDKVYRDVRDEVTKQLNLKLTAGQFIEGAMIVREETTPYWPILLRSAGHGTSEFKQKVWNFREHGKAVILRMSSIKLALAAFQCLNRLRTYHGVQFGWVEDHCARSLDTMKLSNKDGTAFEETIEIPSTKLSDEYRTRLVEVPRNEVSVHIGNIPRGISAAKLTRYIRGGALYMLTIVRDGAMSGDRNVDEALVHFTTTTAANTYAAYAKKHPIIIGTNTLIVTRGFANRILDSFPKTQIWLPPSPQTRVVIFTRLPAGMVKERKSLELLIDTSVQRKLDYESFYFHEDMAMVRFLNVDHARCALIAMQNSFLEFGAEFADDPCAESLSTIGKPM